MVNFSKSMYRLDRIMEAYDRKIGEVRDAEEKLIAAISDFDLGQYLPPPDKVRLDIEQVSGRYFQGWIVCGPLSHLPGDPEGPTCFLKPMGGDMKVRPRPGQEFTAADGRVYRWSKIFSPTFGVVSLQELFGQVRRAVAYAYCRIKSPGDRTVRAAIQ